MLFSYCFRPYKRNFSMQVLMFWFLTQPKQQENNTDTSLYEVCTLKLLFMCILPVLPTLR